MEDKQELTEIKLELEKVNRRLDNMEHKHEKTYHWDSGSIWVLIPIVAIVMWGLERIFN